MAEDASIVALVSELWTQLRRLFPGGAGTDGRQGGSKQFLKFVFIPFVSLVDALVSSESIDDSTHEPYRSSSVRDSNVILFAFIGGLLLVTLVVSRPGLYEFILSITAVVFYFLCFLAALLVVDEETEYWNALRNSNMFESKNAIKSLNVLFASTVLFILFLSLSAFEWDHVLTEHPLVKTLPRINCGEEVCSYFQYVLAIGDEVPAFGRILRLASSDGPAQFFGGPGEWLKNAIPILTVTYIFGVFRYVLFQRLAVNDLLQAFGQKVDLEFLRKRVERAPEYLEGKLIYRALHSENEFTRRDYINALLEARLVQFVPIFIDKLNQERNAANKNQGLVRIKALMEQNPEIFTRCLIIRSLDALNRQMDNVTIWRAHQRTVQENIYEALLAFAQLKIRRDLRIPILRFNKLYELANGPDGDPLQDRAFVLTEKIAPQRLARSRSVTLTAAE
jgi:hypothetical protein